MRPQFLTLLLLFGAGGARALGAQPGVQPDSAFVILSADSLAGGAFSLGQRWRYHPGDGPPERLAAPSLDDAAWPLVSRGLSEDDAPADWTGTGWFRFRLRVDSSLHAVPLTILTATRGAHELFIDGERLGGAGVLPSDSSTFRGATQRAPDVYAFEVGRDYVLAVRYARPDLAEAQRRFGAVGFNPSVRLAGPHVAELRAETRQLSTFRNLFFGLFLAFAVFHLILWTFNRARVENLYLSLGLLVLAAVAFQVFERGMTENYVLWEYHSRLMNTFSVLLGLTVLPFIYTVFYARWPRGWYAFLAAAPLVLLATWLQEGTVGYGMLYMMATCVEMLRVVGAALWKRKAGARIIGSGAAALAVAVLYITLAEDGFLPLFYYVGLVPFSGALALILSMSVFVSRSYAQTTRDLERQLVRVQELSAAQLEEERRARAAAVERQRMQDEYERKLQELEEARELQLSMLPQALPEHAGLDIAAFMQTATEVGGDYYDFKPGPEGALVVAVGDATGHGMKAGTMVTATKSLFNAYGGGEPLDFIGTSTRALKAMNLRKLYMALTLAVYREGTLRLATAGMPATLVWRAEAGCVEEVPLKGMPLGSFPGFPYQEATLRLAPGDVVLFQSDGFPELFNPAGEMLGYDVAVRHFAEADHSSAQAVIDHLLACAAAWSDGRPTDDDLTFVVLRVTR